MGSQQPCIYRVPSQMREVKPEAYKPRMLLIGPLYHSSKPIAHKGTAHPRYLEYGWMEDHKRMYKAAFTVRPGAIAFIDQMSRTIISEENNIRASYAVSTEWISHYIFVELILNDSIFILEFILRTYENRGNIGDLIIDNQFYTNMVLEDLALLENQLPYFCLEKLLDPIIQHYCGDSNTLTDFILKLFSVNVNVHNERINFNHCTDMYRCIYVKSLGQNPVLQDTYELIRDMKNVEKLSSVGVEFKKETDKNKEYSLNVSYKSGCLTLPRFHANETSKVILRNIIAYEQCHDPGNAYTTNYIHFMNCLITSNKDVEILAASGVLTNGVGQPSMVLKTVNDFCTGVQISGNSQYHEVLKKLEIRYGSYLKWMWARLKQVYFPDLWKATATLAAISLVLLTLAGTVAAIIQAKTPIIKPK